MSGWHGSHQYGGWSPEELNPFNKLAKIVKQDRENNTHFQAQYEICLNEGKNKKQKEKPNIQSFEHIKISPHWKFSTMATTM